MKSRQQQGFTLIELMIVIAIIGILAAIATTQYQDFTTRSKVAEGLKLVATVQTAAAVTYHTTGGFPVSSTNASYGLPKAVSIAGTYVASIDMVKGGGKIYITYRNNIGGNPSADGKHLEFVPVVHTGSIEWVCGEAKAMDGSTPAAADTDMPLPYLPGNCR